MLSLVRTTLYVVPALLSYAVLAYYLNFIQDDAYISFRYVANFLGGDGLVYNIGERVEGFTNFGWVVLLIQFGSLGLDFIFWSQVAGFLFGAGIIVLTYLMARFLFEEQLTAVIATLLVGANMSLAYWAPAGLETAAFGFFAMLSLYCYLRRSYWLIWALFISVWIRPEGGLVALLLLVVEAIDRRSLPNFSLKCGLAAFVLSLPFIGFKLFYYGSILPNSFYAKTGFSLEQLSSGLEYVGQFLWHYGFVGVPLVVMLARFQRLSNAWRSLVLFTLLFSIYIALVGGDVLKVHRFFLPLMGLYAVIAVGAIRELGSRVVPQWRTGLMVGVGILTLLLTLYLPRDEVETFNRLEKALAANMHFIATRLKASDETPFTIASTTIGLLGYELRNHRLIDMLGLTDTTIARHPQSPIIGLESTWKERNYNSDYLLRQKPDYILFSTNMKPSAPAEQALFLYPEFLNSYRSVGWPARLTTPDQSGVTLTAYKRWYDFEGEYIPVAPVDYVRLFKEAQEEGDNNQLQRVISLLDSAEIIFNQTTFPYFAYSKALAYRRMNRHEITRRILRDVLAADSNVFEAHRELYVYTSIDGDSATAEIHRHWLRRYAPEVLTATQQRINAQVERNRQMGW
ncbi:MAG: hypothetical protein KOO62_12520 [candidate division Zixibacteria bacterium]|nr:hypothetical protein [candidate division Zixibacteria bacterium]